MNRDNIFEVLGFVDASKYRRMVLNSIIDEEKIPTEIAKELDLKIETVSSALRDLKDVKVAVCLNEEDWRGRRYLATDLGRSINKSLKSRNWKDLFR